MEWGITLDTKGRKMQLARMLWHEVTLRQPDGARRSSEMVLRLTGSDERQFMRDVYGGHAGGCCQGRVEG